MLRALLLALLAGAAPVCKVPVFRYALERWRVSPYPGVLFHEGPLSADVRQRLLALEESGLNVAVEPIDVRGTLREDDRILWDLEKGKPLPRLVLSYPERPEAVAWSGPLTADTLRQLVASPARGEIVRRLVTGTSVVWALFESGDAAADGAAAALAEAELARLEKEIQIPIPGPEDPPLRSAVPLKVAFSVLRVPKDRAEEAVFVQSIARARKAWSLPALVPVFGRGRALASLCGEEIHPAAVRRMAEYITDECSCEVKELNPGVDLLFAADWEALLQADPAPPELKAPPVVLQQPKAPAPPSEAPVSATAPAPSRHLLWAGLGAATAVALLAGLFAFRKAA